MASVWGYEVEQLIEMEREELGLVILAKHKPGDQFHPMNEALGAREEARRASAPQEQAEELMQAASSACKWLENEGYVALDANASTGWMRVTRLASRASAGPRAKPALRLLDAFSLHPLLDEAASAFKRGDLDAAVTMASKAVEVGVRNAASASRSLTGLDLMKATFLAGGLLEDPRISSPENSGRAMFYQGFIGWWRNLALHHTWPAADPQPVAEIILTANYLLRTADEAARDKTAGWP